MVNNRTPQINILLLLDQRFYEMCQSIDIGWMTVKTQAQEKLRNAN